MDWLNRILVCTSEEPRDLGALASALISRFGECTKIFSLSSFKFILTFPTQDRMEEVLSNNEELDLWFVSVKKWDDYDYWETRRVCIEIFGVPPHGWTWDNFKKVADICGRIVCLGKSIARIHSFDSMKVLIETDRFHTIEADVILSIEDSGYRLKIKEVGSSPQVIQPARIPCSSPLAEALDSNHGVVGFEDLDDEVALEDDVEYSDWRRDVIVNAKRVGKEVNETSKFKLIQTLQGKMQARGQPI